MLGGRTRLIVVGAVAAGFLLGAGLTSLVMLGPLNLRPVSSVARLGHSQNSSAGTTGTSSSSNSPSTLARASASAPASAAAEPGGGPSPRSRPNIAYDGQTGKWLMFGGTADAAYMSDSPHLFLDDTWSWDGTSWTKEHPSSTPPGRIGAAITYDPLRKLVLMWGGLTDHGQSADFWSWDGSNWNLIPSTVHPPADNTPGWGTPAPILTYDGHAHVLVLIRNNGFHPAAPQSPDVWTWDGSSWAHPDAANPPPIWGTATFDDALGAVLFFGLDANRSPQTWTFAAGKWTQMSSVLSPAIQNDDPPPVVYLGASHTVALVADDGGLWLWKSDWIKNGASATLPRRLAYVVAVDDVHGSVLNFGGGPQIGANWNGQNRAWIWDGSSWKEVR